MLTVQKLGFHYGNRAILHDVSFDVAPGTVFAVLGPNGSGKTTLIRCINSILRARLGTVTLHGERIDKMSVERIAKMVAYMAQRGETSGLTVFDTVLLGRKPLITWQASRRDLELVENMLAQLDLHDKSLRPIGQLSGGEQQKVALARILVQDAKLLLLDEPTSALDVKNRFEILSLLQTFVRDRGLIALLSIHDINDALRFADRLLFLKSGGVIAIETPDTLSEQTVEQVFGLPVKILSDDVFRFVMPR